MNNPAPNIMEKPTAYVVQVKRSGVTSHVYISKRTPRALACAIAARDAICKTTPPKPSPAPRSNTGILGVSETTQWRRGHPYPVFLASWTDPNGKRRYKRIIYGANRPRSQALKEAIAAREQGMKPEGE